MITQANRNFQSTLLQEERPGTGGGIFDNLAFNPRSYKRSDCCSIRLLNLMVLSIHAPTRGATAKSVGWNACLDLSIHAPTRGATQNGMKRGLLGATFNPRSYKRSDKLRQSEREKSQSFNPRSYKRSDKRRGTISSLMSLSIHAPTRGATIFVHYL